MTLSSDFPLGLWRGWAYVHFPLAGIVYPGARSRRRRRCRAARTAHDTTRAGRRATTPTSPACANTSAAIRCSASRGRPSRAAPAGTPRSSTAPAAAARVTLDWSTLPAALDGRSAPVAPDRVGARRRARGAPVRAAHPGRAACRSRQGRDHRRAALTALALFPRESAAMSSRALAAYGARARDAASRAADADADPLARRAAARGAAAAGAAPADLGRRARHRCSSALRLAAACAATARGRDAPPARIPSWALALFARRRRARGPRVVRLLRRARPVGRVPVRPGRHQVPRDAHARATARCSSASRASCSSRRSSTASRCSPRSPRCRRCCWSARRSTCSRDAGRRDRGRSPGARRCGAARVMIAAGHSDRGRCCSCCSRASPRRCGACRPTHARADRACPTRWRRARSASCRCPTRSRSASTSTARRRRRAQRYWRGPVLSRFDGREWSLVAAARRRRARAAGGGRADHYTVTLEPHGKPWLFALDLPAEPAARRTASRRGERRRRRMRS